jgi:large subunit ribosomal protein L4
MPEISVRNWRNEAVKTLELDPAVFDYPLKKHLIYEAVLAFQAAGRRGTHKVKNRVEVSGGTRKLWRQKHTGRSRMGDNRSPLWRHGGTTHGPTPRDYGWSLPKKMKRNALRSVLTQKLHDDHIVCLEDFALETHKTADLERVLATDLGILDKTLLVTEGENRNLELAARNNPRLKVVRSLSVNIVDVMYHDTVLFSEAALTRLNEVLAR